MLLSPKDILLPTNDSPKTNRDLSLYAHMSGQSIQRKHPRQDRLRKAMPVIMTKEIGKLRANDRKVFDLLLQRATRSNNTAEAALPLHDDVVYSIRISEILRYLGHTSTSRLRKTLEHLSAVKVLVENPRKNDGETIIEDGYYLSSFSDFKGSGILEFSFGGNIQKYVHDRNAYASLSLDVIKQFRSGHAAKIYEIMALHAGRRNSKWEISLEDFKSFLGIPEQSYGRFNSLRQRVIDVAVNEINRIVPSFFVAVGFEKSGPKKKVTKIKFTATYRTSEKASEWYDACEKLKNQIISGRKKEKRVISPAPAPDDIEEKQRRQAEKYRRSLYGHTDDAINACALPENASDAIISMASASLQQSDIAYEEYGEEIDYKAEKAKKLKSGIIPYSLSTSPLAVFGLVQRGFDSNQIVAAEKSFIEDIRNGRARAYSSTMNTIQLFVNYVINNPPPSTPALRPRKITVAVMEALSSGWDIYGVRSKKLFQEWHDAIMVLKNRPHPIDPVVDYAVFCLKRNSLADLVFENRKRTEEGRRLHAKKEQGAMALA